MSNVAQWATAEKESPAFYAWGESQLRANLLAAEVMYQQGK